MLNFKNQNKHKYFFYVFLITISSILFSCNNKKANSDKNDLDKILIEPNQDDIALNLSSIGSSFDIVKLESSENSRLSNFAQLIHVDDSNIIFRDRDRILIFDQNGKYLSDINAKGGGPMEYGGILNTYVDSELNIIYIIDRKNIKTYNYVGEFIKNIAKNAPSGGISRLNNDGFILTKAPLFKEKNREMLKILDNNLSKIKVFKSNVNYDLENIKQDFIFTSKPYSLKNEIFYKEPLADTIFRIDDNSLKPHWIFDFNEYKLDIKDAISIEKSNNSRDKILDFGFYESNDYFFLKYYYQESFNFSVYDKNLKEYIFRRKYSKEKFETENLDDFSMGIENDYIDNAPKFWPSYINDNLIAGFISPEVLNERQLISLDMKLNDNNIVFILDL